MKKVILVVLINISLLFLIEVFSYLYICNVLERDSIFGYMQLFENKSSYLVKYPSLSYVKDEDLFPSCRPFEKGIKKSVILFGCSFVEGSGLEDNQTFSHKLAKYTDRSVINRGVSSSGITHLYWQLNQEEILSSFPKDTEFFIYNFIDDHINRLYYVRSWILDPRVFPKYKVKNNKLVEIKRNLFFYSSFTAYLWGVISTKFNMKNKKKIKELVTLLFNESYSIIKENFPNAKFVLLVMDNGIDLEFFNELDEDIIILRVETYDDEKYYLEDKLHPSEAYWDKVVPYISENLKL